MVAVADAEGAPVAGAAVAGAAVAGAAVAGAAVARALPLVEMTLLALMQLVRRLVQMVLVLWETYRNVLVHRLLVRIHICMSTISGPGHDLHIRCLTIL